MPRPSPLPSVFTSAIIKHKISNVVQHTDGQAHNVLIGLSIKAKHDISREKLTGPGEIKF